MHFFPGNNLMFTVVGHYLLFKAGYGRVMLDSAVIETKVLPRPPLQNWDSTSPYYNLCQVVFCSQIHLQRNWN